MHKPTRERPGPSKKPAPNMKIQMPVKLPRPSMRHQPLLDPIDREAPRRLSRQVLFIHPPQQKTCPSPTGRKLLPAPRNSPASAPIDHMPFVRSPSVLSYQNDIEFMETTGRRLCWFINETSSSMDDKRKTKHEFIRQAIKEAVARMKPELH